MFVTTQAAQLPLGTGLLLSSQFQLVRSSELCRNRLPSKSSRRSSACQRTRPGPVLEMRVPNLFSQGVTSLVSCLHHHSFEAAVPAPFPSCTVYSSGFSVLCNPVSVRISLQFSLLLTGCN